MSQGGLTQAGWSVEQDMVQCLAPAFGGSDGYVQIVLYLILSDELGKVAGSEVGVKWYVLGAGFT